ncbi:Nramp family divalent metal transporter [Ignisphaera sp. 4213-co]|uniref:Nramp family divalent metal transporter n=1 Tax=Ignisphaera cupida TaxID=3050454 RepID=A0ABD4Z674_9CREN|nr:Nramp family divalent metal transporter [Ignisphaera sp. 4213-co]MDK6028614.1 Nramp family divalent metal transporter [Ignisphaera sp. 4213-co]
MLSRLEKELEVVDNLPPPPPLTFKNVMRIIGPSAIVLGVAIGSGEWLIGPANAVLYGAGIMWIATVSILLQTLLNAEMVRYTKYTGEPIFNGMLRLWPGPRFWGPLLIVLSVLERAWPAWAFASATALAAAFLGRIPGAGDEITVMITGLLLALLIVAIVSFGGVIERALEIVQWIFIFLIIGFLIFLNVLLTPAKVASDVAAGFFKFGYFPRGATVALLAALAGYAGAGGLNNTTITNYYRDKGFGMGSIVGAIPSLIRGKKITVSPKGKIFKITSENLDAWRKWRLLTWIDIVGIFTTGAFIGMYLCVALAVALIPPGTQIGGWGVAAYQGNTLAARLGFAGWVIALLTGFWILFSTQLGSTDMITRTLTDLLWSFSDRVRKWAGGEIKKLYYTVLTFITIWIFFAFALTYLFKIQPFIWILLVANISNIVLGIVAIATAYMNRKWLPKEIRAPLWSTIILILGALFFWFFFAVAMILNQFFGIKF